MKNVVAATMLLVSSFALGQTTDVAYMPIVDKFFASLKAEKMDIAVDDLYSDNRWMKAKADDLAKVKSTLKGWPQLFGAFLGYERITDERIGGRYVHLDFVVYYERQPIRVYLEFYKPQDKWVTNNLGFESDIDDWAKERAKAKYVYNR